MKFSRSLGRSITLHSETDNLRRKIKRYADGKIVDVPSISVTDSLLLIRQTISGVDKIYQKPQRLSEMSVEWYMARERLGRAVWAKLQKRFSLPTDSKTLLIWRWKLHPYAECKSVDEDLEKIPKAGAEDKGRPAKNYRGRWHDVFVTTEKGGDPINYDSVASSLMSHLYEAELRIDGKLRKSKRKTIGLVTKRARSIEQSVPKTSCDPAVIEFDGGLSAEITSAYRGNDVAAALHKRALELENRRNKKGNPTPGRLSSKDLGRALYQHYEDIGLCDPSLPDNRRLALQELHNAVREFYRARLRNSKRGVRGHNGKKLSTILPKNHDTLVARMAQVSGNRTINDLIRHGRIVFYSNLHHEEFGKDAGEAARHFWTSEGQAEIKRAEAFTRIWRTVKDQAARTAKSWADPEGILREKLSSRSGEEIVSDDVLMHGLLQRATGEDFDPDWYRIKAELLFGSAVNIVCPPGQEDKWPEILRAALLITSRIRTDVVHFTTRRRFAKRLTDSVEVADDDGPTQTRKITPDTQQLIRQLFLSDLNMYRRRVHKDLEGAGVAQFVEPATFNKVARILAKPHSSSVPVPRFNRVLNRLDGTVPHLKLDGKDLRKQFPRRANRSSLEEPANRAKFTVLKLAYERLFGDWLGRRTEAETREMVSQVLNEGVKLAKAIQRNSPFESLIQSKAESIRNSCDGGFVRVMDELAALVATEIRDQNAYEPNPELARKNSEWIEKFKCDLIGVAFARFIADAKLEALLEIAPGQIRGRPQPVGIPMQSLSDCEAWEANLYFFLHLVPVEDVSRLVNQLKKTAVLEEKADSLEGSSRKPAAGQTDVDLVERLQLVLSLYLDMNADKFEGTMTQTQLDAFADFFEKPADFTRLYPQDSDSLDAPAMSMKRGLRQLLRFGHVERLRALFTGHKVKTTHVSTVLEKERRANNRMSSIAQLQKDREDLHHRITAGRGEVTGEDINRYRQLVDEIARHRQLSADARLVTHLKVHHMMMRVVFRLIDYAGTWERDRLFVFLGLLARRNAKAGKAAVSFADLGLRAGDVWSHMFSINSDRWREKLDEADRRLFDAHFGDDKASVRNQFAHYNNLSLDREDIDLTDEMNSIRKLMAYDRKRKNAVSKSVRDLLEQEGLKASWAMKDHQLVLASMESDEIRHLKTKAVMGGDIRESKHGELFVRLARALFEEPATETQ